jgi:tRNA-Thr(GGU) m(6)t(6)A37 methyltransferase TsaA
MELSYRPIGVIHSPFDCLEEMPIQPTGEASAAGTVEVFPEFAEGLADLEGFSHIYLLYHFHKVCARTPGRATKLRVIPFLDTVPRSLFATRAPSRPNPIGLSLVKLLRIERNLLHVDRLDVLDGTPLLDIKPYVPAFEPAGAVRTGWLEQAQGQVRTRRSDARFGGVDQDGDANDAG